MKENDFLFKLGLILAPALFASSSALEAVLIAASVAMLIFTLHAFTFASRKVFSGFFEEGVVLLAIAALTMMASLAVRKLLCVVPIGVFFPVALANALIFLRGESLEAKGKIILWFVIALLLMSFLRDRSQILPESHAFIFFAIGFFLFSVRLFLKKKWCLL